MFKTILTLLGFLDEEPRQTVPANRLELASLSRSERAAAYAIGGRRYFGTRS